MERRAQDAPDHGLPGLPIGSPHSTARQGAMLKGGMGMADGGSAKFSAAFWAYALPRAIWLAVWLVILYGRRKAKQ